MPETMAPPTNVEEKREQVEDDGLGPVGSDPAEATQEPVGEQTPEPEPPMPPADLPKEEEDQPEGEAQLFLIGNRALGVKVGGRKPDSSTLKYTGAKVDVDGQFDREDTLLMVDLWQVTGDNDQDTIEKATGVVKSTSKAQKATLRAATPLKRYLEERLEEQPEALAIVLDALALGEE